MYLPIISHNFSKRNESFAFFISQFDSVETMIVSLQNRNPNLPTENSNDRSSKQCTTLVSPSAN